IEHGKVGDPCSMDIEHRVAKDKECADALLDHLCKSAVKLIGPAGVQRRTSTPSNWAALPTLPIMSVWFGPDEFDKTAKRLTFGTTSLSSLRSLPKSSGPTPYGSPVTLSPRCARLATSPCSTGLSKPIPTMGMILVAFFSAR